MQTIKSEQELNTIIRNEIVKYLEHPENFAKHLNSCLKHYVETNRQDLFYYYETSVNFICKRNNQPQANKALPNFKDQQLQIQNLVKEIEQTKAENARLKQQLEDLKKEVANLNSEVKNKKNTPKKKSRCSIM